MKRWVTMALALALLACVTGNEAKPVFDALAKAPLCCRSPADFTYAPFIFVLWRLKEQCEDHRNANRFSLHVVLDDTISQTIRDAHRRELLANGKPDQRVFEFADPKGGRNWRRGNDFRRLFFCGAMVLNLILAYVYYRPCGSLGEHRTILDAVICEIPRDSAALLTH